MSDPEQERDYFARGKAILGKSAGGLLARLLKSKKGCIELARASIEMAATKQDPREYIAKVVGSAPQPTGSNAVEYARSHTIRGLAQLSTPDVDKSNRPTLEEMRRRYGPNWGLGGHEMPAASAKSHCPTPHGAWVRAELEARAERRGRAADRAFEEHLQDIDRQAREDF